MMDVQDILEQSDSQNIKESQYRTSVGCNIATLLVLSNEIKADNCSRYDVITVCYKLIVNIGINFAVITRQGGK